MGPFFENQTRNTPVQFPKDSKKQHFEFQRNGTDMTVNGHGDDNISAPKTTTSQIERKFVRDEITDELCMPLSSTIVLKRENKMVYLPLDFKKGLKIAGHVDSGAYVSAIA